MKATIYSAVAYASKVNLAEVSRLADIIILEYRDVGGTWCVIYITDESLVSKISVPPGWRDDAWRANLYSVEAYFHAQGLGRREVLDTIRGLLGEENLEVLL